MKTQKTNGQSLYLKTTNKRWKWMAGATAATAAGVTASHASLVTINLSNNYISALSGNHLNADLTGDGRSDIIIANAAYGFFYRTTYSGYRYINLEYARVHVNGVLASAYFDHYPLRFFQIGSHFTGGTYPATWPSSLRGSIPISFQDLRFNNGKLTQGSLNVIASIDSRDNFPRIQLDSFTYNSIPDQGSSLALLAMGAGGILALRRWRTGKEQS